MDSLWFEFLAKQLPLVALEGIFLYFMYKYLTSQIDKRDKTIEIKDIQILKQNEQVLTLYGQAIESQNKSIAVKEKMLTVIDRLERDIEKLNQKL